MMDDNTPEREDAFGHKRTSSFKSSGRAKPLMGDAVHFATKRDEETLSNLGPGSYYYSDPFSADNRMTTIRVPAWKSMHVSGGVANAERPWKQPAPLLIRNNKPVSSALSKQQLANTGGGGVTGSINSSSNKLAGNQNNIDDLVQLQKDIAAVRNLPSYG
jgi:hypothetical protein